MITGPINALEPTYNRDHMTDPWRQFMAEILLSALYDVSGDGRVPKEARGRAREEAEHFFDSGEYAKYANALEIEPSEVYRAYEHARANEEVKRQRTGRGYLLSKGEKIVINNMLRAGKTYTEIGRHLGRHETTILKYARRTA
jgi:hypothetical protein